MSERLQSAMKARFEAAAQSLVDKVKDDPNVIAIIVCGSLAYDVVWEKSDIDMTIVVRDQQLVNDSYCVIEDGITINVRLVVRSAFRRSLERNIGGQSAQSYYAKGRIVYTTDESLYGFFEDVRRIGSDDIALSMLFLANELVFLKWKSEKWLTVRKDPLYAQYYLLGAAETIADMELCLRGEPSSRESIQKALQLNPEVIRPFYCDAMSHHMSDDEIAEAIERIDAYLEQHLDIIKRPVIEFMSDQEVKTITLIAKRFRTNAHYIINIIDYLADKGVIEKVSQTIRLTPKGRQAVEEVGFLYVP